MRLRTSRILDMRRTVAVRSIAIAVSISVQTSVSFRNNAHCGARARRECLGASDDFVTRERRTVLRNRPKRTAAPVVNDDRPLAAHAMIEVSARLEEPGKFVEHFYRK